MKRTALLLALLIAGTSSAVAAPKPLEVKKLTLIAVNQSAEKLVISGKTLVTVANTDGPVSYTHLTLPTNREV